MAQKFTKIDFIMFAALAICLLITGALFGNAYQNHKINKALIERDLAICYPPAIEPYLPNTGINDLEDLYTTGPQDIDYWSVNVSIE